MSNGIAHGVAPRRVVWQGTLRGQSTVEFALAVPIFLLLLFGILEVGMLFKTYSAYQEGAQQAARVIAGEGIAADADTQGLLQLQRTIAGENPSTITSITIYDATATGAYVPVTGCATLPCPNTYTTYVYSPVTEAFACTAAGVQPPCPSSYWNPKSRNVSVLQLDHVGVKIVAPYKSVTGALRSLTLVQTGTALLEPSSFGP